MRCPVMISKSIDDNAAAIEEFKDKVDKSLSEMQNQFKQASFADDEICISLKKFTKHISSTATTANSKRSIKAATRWASSTSSCRSFRSFASKSISRRTPPILSSRIKSTNSARLFPVTPQTAAPLRREATSSTLTSTSTLRR